MTRRRAIVRSFAGAALGVLMLAVWSACASWSRPANASARASGASRIDHGALIVLDVRGSYEAMGRQQAQLLGATATDAARLFEARWTDVVRTHGMPARLVDLVLFPVWSATGWLSDDSSFFAETRGIAHELGYSAADGIRLVFGSVFGGGSTGFVATRSATRDGAAIIGRNVDWADDDGLRPPVVVRYHPDNGDLVHLTAGWPLVAVPIVGMNEAGFAISIHFFDADPTMAFGPPRLLYRRVLQRAATVGEAIDILGTSGNRGGAGFLVLADAAGDFALAECSAIHCAIHRPTDDWLVQSNHARTHEMMAHDRGRTADSYRRRHAMESAVRPHLGAITPVAATEILRDRSNSRYVNDSTVANLDVLNAAILHPASRTFWHSTTQQPLAPFGAFVPLSVTGEASTATDLEADRRLGGPDMTRELGLVTRMRGAARRYAAGDVESAVETWDELASAAEPILQPARMAWARAAARLAGGRLDEASDMLSEADTDDAPFEVRAHAIVVNAMVADRRGDRAAALHEYARARAYLDAHPEYDSPFVVGALRSWIQAGLDSASAGPMPPLPDLQAVPR